MPKFIVLTAKSTCLENATQVVGVVADTGGMDLASDSLPPIDLVEIRLDLIASEIPEIACPLIFTSRSSSEGGSGGSIEERLAQLREQLPRAAYLDLELATLQESEEARQLAMEAQEAGVQIIGSFHDFEKTPPREFLIALKARAQQLPVNLLKVATRTDDLESLFALAELQRSAVAPTATMGMGTFGKSSRILLAQVGSQLTYGYLNTPSAPGQWPAADLREALQDDLPS